MITKLAAGLETHNPLAYMILFLILMPPTVFILMSFFEWMQEKIKKGLDRNAKT